MKTRGGRQCHGPFAAVSWLAAIPMLCLAMTTALAEPRLIVRSPRILLPLATEESMDAGRVETDPSRGLSALQIDVISEETGRGWILYLRAEQSTFAPEGAGKVCSDLKWKLDQESEGAYRRLEQHDVVVLENPAGGDARITIDVAVELGWQTEPGTYGLGLVFRIEDL